MNLKELEGTNTMEINAFHFEYALSLGAYLTSEDLVKATKESKDMYITEFKRRGDSEEFIKGAIHMIDLIIESEEAIATKHLEEYLEYKERLKNSLEH